LIPRRPLIYLFYDDFRQDHRVRHNNLLIIVGAKNRGPQTNELNPAGASSHRDLVTHAEGAFYQEIQASNEILGHILRRQAETSALRQPKVCYSHFFLLK
jgi:hypothetical protein